SQFLLIAERMPFTLYVIIFIGCKYLIYFEFFTVCVFSKAFKKASPFRMFDFGFKEYVRVVVFTIKKIRNRNSEIRNNLAPSGIGQRVFCPVPCIPFCSAVQP